MPSAASDERPEIGPPLWSIGLIVGMMFLVPIILYSMAPAGPMREGDTIYSKAQTIVSLVTPQLYDKSKYDGTCLLDPNSPLIILQRPSDRPEATILARLQGASRSEWPFCPPQADVIVTQLQVAQKSDLFGEAKTSLLTLFGK